MNCDFADGIGDGSARSKRRSWNPSASILPEFSLLMGREVMPRMVIDPIATRTHGVALANVMLDGDDVLRHAVLILRHGKRLLPSLSLRVAADALGVPLSQIRLTPVKRSIWVANGRFPSTIWAGR